MSARTITTEMPIIITTDDLSDIGYAADTAYLKWVQAVVITHWEGAVSLTRTPLSTMHIGLLRAGLIP